MWWVIDVLLWIRHRFMGADVGARFEKHLLEAIAIVMLLSAIICAILMIVYKMRASYGRYKDESILGNVR